MAPIFESHDSEPPERASSDLHALKGWVVDTFDHALQALHAGADRLATLHALVAARAAALGGLADARQPAFIPVPAHHRRQLQRLSGLAPAAVEWVRRHDAADPRYWDQFRHHLEHRCEAIIHESPHADVNDE
jgi:hypothetical protein